MVNIKLDEHFSLTSDSRQWIINLDERAITFGKVQSFINHKLSDLKIIFFEVTGINTPADLLLDSDEQFFENSSANLQDKFFQCSVCNQWAYFQSFDKQVCVLCWKKQNPEFKHPAVLVNKNVRLRW